MRHRGPYPGFILTAGLAGGALLVLGPPDPARALPVADGGVTAAPSPLAVAGVLCWTCILVVGIISAVDAGTWLRRRRGAATRAARAALVLVIGLSVLGAAVARGSGYSVCCGGAAHVVEVETRAR